MCLERRETKPEPDPSLGLASVFLDVSGKGTSLLFVLRLFNDTVLRARGQVLTELLEIAFERDTFQALGFVILLTRRMGSHTCEKRIKSNSHEKMKFHGFRARQLNRTQYPRLGRTS